MKRVCFDDLTVTYQNTGILNPLAYRSILLEPTMNMINRSLFTWKTASLSQWILPALLATAVTAHAVDGTWKTATGSGVWSATGNWTGNPNPVPGGVGSS
ncbi:MAG: hypothetical protein WCQ57_01505, partial [Verrucomicrobiota bacterium]